MESDRAFISHVIYPEHLLYEHGRAMWLIGWNIDEFKCVIGCSILKSEVTFQDLEQALQWLQSDSRYISYQYSLSTTSPIILGEWTPNLSSDYIPDKEHTERGIWITLMPSIDRILHDSQCTNLVNIVDSTVKTRLPSLHCLYSLGNRYSTTTHMISYPHIHTHSLHSVTLSDPLRVHLQLNNESKAHSPSSSPQNMSAHTSGPLTCTELEVIVGLVNYAEDLNGLITDYLSNRHVEPSSSAISSVCSTIVNNVFRIIYKVLKKIANIWYYYLFLIHKICSRMRPILSYFYDQLLWRKLKLSVDLNSPTAHSSPPYAKPPAEDSTPLPPPSLRNLTKLWKCLCDVSNLESSNLIVDVSLDTLSLCCVEIVQKYITLQSLYKESLLFFLSYHVHPTLRTKLYHNILQKVGYMWSDSLLGIGAGYLLLYVYYTPILTLCSTFPQLSTSIIEEYLVWFTQSPGGIKLNPYITTKLSKLFIHFLHSSLDTLQPLCIRYAPFFLHFLAYQGGFGLSVQVSFLLDCFYLCTTSYYIVYMFFTHMCHILVSSLQSMYLLFQGSKINILRNRIDSNVYDNTQLLFGILFFSIFFFLFPSFAIYYYFFSVLIFLATALQYALYLGYKVQLYFPVQYGYNAIVSLLLYEFSTDSSSKRVITRENNIARRQVRKDEEADTFFFWRYLFHFAAVCIKRGEVAFAVEKIEVSYQQTQPIYQASESNFLSAHTNGSKVKEVSSKGADVSFSIFSHLSLRNIVEDNSGEKAVDSKAKKFTLDEQQIVKSNGKSQGIGRKSGKKATEESEIIDEDNDQWKGEGNESESTPQEESADYSAEVTVDGEEDDALYSPLSYHKKSKGTCRGEGSNTSILHRTLRSSSSNSNTIYLCFSVPESYAKYFPMVKKYFQITLPSILTLFSDLLYAIFKMKVMPNNLIAMATSQQEAWRQGFEQLVVDIIGHLEHRNVDSKYEKEMDLLHRLRRTDQFTFSQYLSLSDRCLKSDEERSYGRNRLNATSTMKRQYMRIMTILVVCSMVWHFLCAFSSVILFTRFVCTYPQQYPHTQVASNLSHLGNETTRLLTVKSSITVGAVAPHAILLQNFLNDSLDFSIRSNEETGIGIQAIYSVYMICMAFINLIKSQI